MTQDEIIEMARQAGYLDLFPINRGMELKELEAFAKLVAAKAFQDGYEKGVAAFNEAVLIERERIHKATHPPQRTEQEPWCMKMNGCTAKCEDCPDEPPTPQRTWVDLTRTQMQDVYFEVLKEHRGGHQMEGQLAFGEALQAKIREKNT
jgi:hypothetical protein